MIYLTHGVVPHWSAERISHALFLPEWLLALHLEHRPAKYVSLTHSLAGEGDALTIDDATYGGLRAALLARRYGHSVSWFVNGLHVDRSLQYFPFQLSSMLDDTRQSECLFDDQEWKLRRNIDRRIFRRYLKQRYMRMRRNEEVSEFVETVSSCLNVYSAAIEHSHRTVTFAELAAAAEAGVDLQNHGWSHLNPQLFSSAECTATARLNEDYLSQFRETDTRAYAPPFGQPVMLTSNTADLVLLADRGLNADHRRGRIVNRQDLLFHELPTQIVRVEQIRTYNFGNVYASQSRAG
jgi:peptidoglycan/xylan/chitin deacetylase (PgdA/CDA1 family)